MNVLGVGPKTIRKMASKMALKDTDAKTVIKHSQTQQKHCWLTPRRVKENGKTMLCI